LISAGRNDDRIGSIERLGHELEKIDHVASELILQIGFEADGKLFRIVSSRLDRSVTNVLSVPISSVLKKESRKR